MTLLELIDLAGVDRALEITARLGGRNILVSGADDPHGVGADVWRALQESFAGEKIEIPRHLAVQHFARRQRAAGMLRAGESISRTARQTGLSRRTIRRIRLADQR